MTRFVGTPLTGIEFASESSEAFSARVDEDTNPRIRIDAGGRITWSSGAAAGDTTLYRASADTLKTDDNLNVGAKLSVLASSGDEGGEISLARAQTNTTLAGPIIIDSYQNKIRFFEDGGTNRGAYIDLTACAGGAGTNLLTGGGGGATTLDELSDVVITSATSGDFLKFNGTNWVNDPINLGTDTVGNYVASLVAGTNVTLANNSGEGATPTVTVSGALTSIDSISSPDFVQFDTSIGNPASVEGRLQWNSDFGTLSFGLDNNNSVHQIGINQFAYCYNAEATTLNKGEAVYIFGGQGSQVSIKRALNTSDATSARTLGLVSESIAAGASGYVCTYGVLAGIDTSAYTVGQILYLGASAGQLTTTKPAAPNHYVFIGVVIKANVGGEIWIRPQNGYELDEIHDVSITTPSSGQFLKYNGTLWVNDAIDLGTDTTGDYVASITGTANEIDVTGSGEGAAVTLSLPATINADTTGNAATATKLATARTIELTGDVTGSASFDGSANASITATIAANSVALGTDTTGNYMTDVSAGTGISIAHTPGEGSTATITNAGVTSVNGSTGSITGVVTTADTGTVTSTMISDGTIVNGDINASAAISLSKLASGTSGQIVVANSSGVPTYTTVSGDITISDTGVAAIAANSVALGTDTTGDYVASLVAGYGIGLANNSGEGATPTVKTSFVGAKAYRSSNLSRGNNSFVNVSFNAQEYDTHGFFAPTSTDMTIPSGLDGYYLIQGSIEYAASATGVREAGIQLNGTNLTYMFLNNVGSILGTVVNISAVVYCAATDVITLDSYQNSGGSLNILGSSTPSRTWLAITFLGA